MKIKDITSNIDAPEYFITSQNYENIFNVYEDDNNYYYNLLRTIDFPDVLSNNLYTIYEVGREEHYTVISYKHYGTTRLWWIITGANNIMDPSYPPPVGTRLKIIKPTYINDILSEIKNQTKED